MPRRLDYEVVFFELSLRFRKLEQVSLRIRVWRGIYVGLAYEKEFSVTCCNGNRREMSGGYNQRQSPFRCKQSGGTLE